MSYRGAEYNLLIVGMWSEVGQDKQLIEWVRGLCDAVRPFSFGGVYLNYLSNEGDDRVRAAYSPGKYERLVRLKTKYDPTNLVSPQPEHPANQLTTRLIVRRSRNQWLAAHRDVRKCVIRGALLPFSAVSHVCGGPTSGPGALTPAPRDT